MSDSPIISLHPTPVEPSPPPKLPPLIAKTMNVCVNCVQAPGRMVAKAATRRYHKHYHARHRFGRHHLAADVAFAVAIVVLLGVNAWFILGKPAFLPSNVRLAWEAPATARVGDAVSLALTIAYEGNEPLDRATLALIPPDGFSVTRVAPGTYDATTHTLTLPAPIAPGASIDVTVDAVVEPPSDRDLTLTATFHGTGASGSERQSTKTSLAVRGVAMVFEMEVPPIVPVHGVVGLQFRYHSEAVIPLNDIVLCPASDLFLDFGGRVTGSGDFGGNDPCAFPHEVVPGERGGVAFEVRTKEAGTFPLNITVFRRADDGTSVALGGFASPLTVREVPVRSLRVGWRDEGPKYLHLGEKVELTVSWGMDVQYGRGSAFPRSFGVRVEGPLSGTSSLQIPKEPLTRPAIIELPPPTIRDGVIRWEAFTMEGISNGQGGTFTLTPPLAIDFSTLNDDTNFAYTLTPFLVFDEASDRTPRSRVEGDPLIVSVAGDLSLSSSARYFTPEGDQIGRGPLPPRVGETTRYWVTWDLRSTIQDAGRTVVHATLPPGVEWTNRVATTAGDGVAYDAATRTITWTVDAVPRTIGSTYPNVSASFELALMPDASMVGQSATLLGESIAESGDVRVVAFAVTTELPLDARARGKGAVE